ncbi:MAG: glycosyltransferase family 39 protein [Planctomycetes bacterium]|nr:glycosyltransferase family 39 protein [Planctomycetota bacterium]
MKRPLIVLIVAGFAARIVLALRSAVVNTDAPTFLRIAQGFVSGDVHAATAEGFHPLYPALMALGGGSETAGWLISAAAGALAGWPLWALIRDLSSERAALIAAAIYELHPSFIDVQSDIFADGLFMLLAACAACGSIRYVLSGRGLWLAAAAAALGLLAKSEGLIVAALTAVTLGWGIWRGRAWRPALGAAMLALAIMGPYVAHLSLESGRFRYSPKRIVELATGSGSEEEEARGVWGKRRAEHGPLASSAWYLGKEILRAMGPAYLVVWVAAILLFRKWHDLVTGKGWLTAWIAVYGGCVWWTNYWTAHQISERYLHPPVALALLWLGPFGMWLFEKRDAPGAVRTWAVRLAALLVVVGGTRDAVLARRFDQIGYREAGQWIRRDHGTKGAVIASTVDKVAYYAEGRLIDFHPQPPDADYWVFSDADARQRAWDWKAADLGAFRLAAEFAGPKGRAVFVLARRP